MAANTSAAHPLTTDFAVDAEAQNQVMPDHGAGFQKMSRKTKWCIGCSVCSGAALAVIIPVTLFVVAPEVAQMMLDKTDISLPNITMMACTTMHTHAINHAKVEVPGGMPLIGKTRMHAYTQKLYAYTCKSGEGAYACDEADQIKTLVGISQAPEMEMSQGVNNVVFEVRMDLVGSLDVLFNGMLGPAFSGHQAVLDVEADDLSVSVMGLNIGGLRMRKTVTCSGVSISDEEKEVPNWVCHQDELDHERDTSSAYTLNCTSSSHSHGGDIAGSKTMTKWLADKAMGLH